MKLIKLTSIALTAGLVISGVGCDKKIDEFGDINTNPGIVAEANTAALLTNVLSGMGEEIWQRKPRSLRSTIFRNSVY